MNGFITPDNGSKEVYFHINNGHAVTSPPPGVSKPKPRFVENMVRTPKIGDRLIYRLIKNAERGPTAAAWAFEADWDQVADAIPRIPHKGGGSYPALIKQMLASKR